MNLLLLLYIEVVVRTCLAPALKVAPYQINWRIELL